MKSSININDYVYVKLTAHGMDTLNQYRKEHRDLDFGSSSIVSFIDDLWQFTIIDLMKIFWFDIRNSKSDANLPFVGGNITIDPLNAELPINLSNDIFVVLTESGEDAMDNYYSSDIRNDLWDKKRRLCNSHLYDTLIDGSKLMSFFLGDFLQIFGEETKKGYDQMFYNDAIMFRKPNYDL